MEEPFQSADVAGVLHRPSRPNGNGLILTHGAGSNSNAPVLVRMARAFEEAGWHVLRYDLPFRRQRPRGSPHPSNAARDRQGVLDAAAAMRKITSGKLAAGGQSYGGRQTAMAASEHPEMADGLVLFSYPLHPPGKPEQLRNAYFPQLRTPVLFVHGTRDPFGTIEELRENIALIAAPNDLIAVEGAGHDLKRAPDLAQEIIGHMLF